MIRKINELLALIIIVGIPALIVGASAAGIELPGEAVGAFLVAFTLVVQFYFRKSEPKA